MRGDCCHRGNEGNERRVVFGAIRVAETHEDDEVEIGLKMGMTEKGYICVDEVVVGEQSVVLGALRSVDLDQNLVGIKLENAKFADERDFVQRRDDDANEPKHHTYRLHARLRLVVR